MPNKPSKEQARSSLSLTQLIKDEYYAIAFANLFDLVRVSNQELSLKPLSEINQAALRAVATLQWHRTAEQSRLVIRMHSKDAALKQLLLLSAKLSTELNAEQLLALSPDQLATLTADVKALG